MPWTIDGKDFTTADKFLVDAEPVTEELTRPGADGTAFLLHAYRAARQTITTTVVVVGEAQSRQFKRELQALQHTVVTVIDQIEEEWTVYVYSVRILRRLQIDGDVHITAVWSLVPQSVRPDVEL